MGFLAWCERQCVRASLCNVDYIDVNRIGQRVSRPGGGRSVVGRGTHRRADPFVRAITARRA
jgi:hypothetical protein